MAQDYKVVQRSLTGGPTVTDPQNGALVVQNFSEFMSYLNEMYLSQGYKIHTVTLLRYVPASDTSANLSEYAYHLVKEVVTEQVGKAK